MSNPILKRTLTGLTVAAVTVAAILCAPLEFYAPVLALLAIAAAAEYAQLLARRERFPSAGYWLRFWPGVLFIAASIFGVLAHLAWAHGQTMFLFVIAVVKISDMGGFACGTFAAHRLAGGTHKLCPSISPNKSWEGLFGSVFASCALALAFMPLTRLGLGRSAAVGVAAAVVGTLGDLVESKFKRYAGVKDSSTMRCTNGMGGVLDMLDSLLIAPAGILCIIGW